MPNDFKWSIKGERELRLLLNTLPKRMIKKGMRRALNLAASPILADAKARCIERTGLLRKSLKKRIKTYSSGIVIAIIGPDRNVSETLQTPGGKNYLYRPANIAHLIEGGHGGPHPASAYPFLKPAYDANEGIAIEITKEKLKETLESEAKKIS